jgi:hypothetical protein
VIAFIDYAKETKNATCEQARIPTGV